MSGNDILPEWATTTTTTTTSEAKPKRSPFALPQWARGGGSTTDVEQATTTTTTVNNPMSIESAAAGDESTEYRRPTLGEIMKRDGHLLLITLGIIVVMNIPFVRWALYPFSIFSTYIHEICHGFAALMAGGRISKLQIFPDTSGLAFIAAPSSARGFVSSAGYQGTAVVGCLLLLFRRTKRGPRSGMMALGLFMVITTCIWIRNAFGIVMILFLGLLLMACAWKVPSMWMRSVYVCVAVTCSLNAITSVRNLFGQNFSVNGEPSETDAHAMAAAVGGTRILWAIIWLLFAFIMTGIGLVFAIPGKDEVADFQCCGVCVDMGCFTLLNTTRKEARGEARNRDSTAPTTTTTIEAPTISGAQVY